MEEEPGANAKPQGKGVGGPGMHAVGKRGNAAGEGGDAVGRGSELGGSTGGGGRVPARARAIASADKAGTKILIKKKTLLALKKRARGGI